MLQKFKTLIKIIELHHQAPVIEPKKRHLGVILTLIGYLLFAFYTILFQVETTRNNSTISLAETFTGFTIFHLSMFLSFLPFCLAKGWYFLKCKLPKLVIARALLSITCGYFYSLARVWTEHVDNSILYSSDAFWVVIIMLLLGMKVNWIAIVGVFIGLGGILFIYSFDYSSIHDLIGGLFGSISGITLGIVIIITRFIVQKDPPIRVGLYHGLLGMIISGIIALYLNLSSEKWIMPNSDAIVVMILSGFLFALTLFCFIEALYYTETYIIGAVSFFLPVFTETINWVLNQTPISMSTIIGCLILTSAGILVVYSPNYCSKKIAISKNRPN